MFIMAKKRKVVRKRSATKNKSSAEPQGKIFSKFKLGIVFRNLVLFVLLFLISWILSVVSEGNVFPDLFYLLWIIFAFISVAFFLALLVLLFLKWIRR